jgi:SAM (Sterile alpha motif) domain-containing protein
VGENLNLGRDGNSKCGQALGRTPKCFATAIGWNWPRSTGDGCCPYRPRPCRAALGRHRRPALTSRADWLEKLGLGQYAQRFAENDISFSILPDLTDQHLEKIGVASLGHRLQLLRAIAELTSREKEAPKPAGPTTAAIASPTVTPSAEATAERRQGQQLGPLCGRRNRSNSVSSSPRTSAARR